MAKMNTLKSILFLLIAILEYVSGDNCELSLGPNTPILLRKVGIKTFIDDRYSAYVYNGAVRKALRRKETIELFCENGFVTHRQDSVDYIEENFSEYITNGNSQTHQLTSPPSSVLKSLKIECSSSSNINDYKLKFTNSEHSKWFDIYSEFQCSFDNLQIYESNATLGNCENFVSYGLSTGLNNPIGICFDLNTFHIKYAKYLANPPLYNFLHQRASVNEKVVDLDVELNNFEFLLDTSFISTSTFDRLYKEKKSQISLLSPFNFEYENLIQDEGITSHIEKYAAIFNVVWWQELRAGNWLNFQKIFSERNQNVTYMIYTGVSGTMTIPTSETPEQFQVNDEKKFIKAPAYIWTYLKSLEENSLEEFVIIAHNTPFYKSGDSEEFCEDICDQVAWLKNSLFQRLHLMPIFGVINCCRPADVANKLDNFPNDPLTTVQPNISPVTTQSTDV